jgi:hypothetical protein
MHDGLWAEVDPAVLAGALRMATDNVINAEVPIGLAARERISMRNSPREIAVSVKRAACMLLDIQ